MSETDTSYMRRALRLAARGAGRTSPNPLVGAVLVRDDRVIGEGYHYAAGEPHAEVNALPAAAHDFPDADVCSFLSPCAADTGVVHTTACSHH